ncbi:Uncharacterised protein [Streptococcus pneumoniae]|nr:Uncharacterised protein [Streptococcus pneumoniae]
MPSTLSYYFENLFKPRQRCLTVGMVTDTLRQFYLQPQKLSSIYNLKTVF